MTTPTGPRSPRPGRGRLWLAAVGLVVLAGLFWALRRGAAPAAAARTDAQARPVPVAAAAVARRDVPVTLEGLGSVTALRTVTIRTQVDGRLDEVLFREGQPVRKGQALAQVDPRPFQIQLAQAEGAQARDAAQLTAARLDLERYRTLVQQKLVSQQQVDAQVALVGQLEGAVQVDHAAVESARLNLSWARIASPVDGVTGIRQVDAGNVIHASDAAGLVVVTQLDPVAVIFSLPQDDLRAVADAMAAGPLEVQVLARDGATALGTGKLEVLDNQINQNTSTLRLKAVVPNPSHHLWPNQFVTARLRLSVRKGALVMPASAVQRGPAGVFTYVVGAESTVAPRPVELAATLGDLVVVGSGLREGEQVVVDGQNLLRPGSKVVIREAARAKGTPAAPAGGGAGKPAAGPETASDGAGTRAADAPGRP